MVRQGQWMEGPKRDVLLLQRVLKGGHASGSGHSRWSQLIRGGSERGKVGYTTRLS